MLAEQGTTRSAHRIALGLIAVIAIGAVVGVVVGTQAYGIGMTPDSIAYIKAARAMLHLQPLPALFSHWPPGYPTLLAAASWLTHGDPRHLAAFYNGLCVALSVVFSAVLIFRQRVGLVWTVLGAAAVAACDTLYACSTMAWSEPTLIVLMLLSFVSLQRAADRGRGFVLAGLLAGLCFLTRYIGFAVAATGVLMLLVNNPRSSYARLRAALIYGLAASVPAVLWLVYNWSTQHNLTGTREASDTSLLQASKLAAAGLLRRSELQLALPLAVVGLILGRSRSGSAIDTRVVWVLWTFAVIYLLALCVLASLIRFDTIDDRLLLPAVVALLVGSFAGIAGLCQRLGERAGAWATTALGLVIGAVLIGRSLAVETDFARVAMVYGTGGYSQQYWHEDPVLRTLSKLRPDMPIESNAPDVIYGVLDWPADATPRHDPHVEPDLQRLATQWPRHPRTLVVWFKQVNPDDVPIETLSQLADHREVERSDDVSLYIFTAQGSPPAP